MENGRFTIPGTNVKIGGLIGSVLSEGFNIITPILGFGSGLLLSQITHIADNLSKETIQNWVKRNFVDPPKNGRFYDENQVARILIFNSLRRVVELEDIKLLLQRVYDSSGGTVREKELLTMFNSSVIRTKEITAGDYEGYERAVGQELAVTLREKEADRSEIKEVIFIMLTAYQSSLLKQQVDDRISRLRASAQKNR